MKDLLEFGFMYRGNGYGFWKTRSEAEDMAKKKKEKDKDHWAIPTLWLCRNKKPFSPSSK